MKRLAIFSFGVLFLLATVLVRADTTLVFNEIMYHPVANEPAMEWIEFHNQLACDLDVSGWRVSGGIDYTFPNNSVIRGRGFAVLAINPSALAGQTGLTNIYGPFTGRLDNGGDELNLRNNSGRLMDHVNYGVNGFWPVGPDGAGVSLVKRDRNTASGPPENWTFSEQLGGTPGADNFPLVGVAIPDTQLVSFESDWKYNGAGQDLGTGWRTTDYDDTSWSSGRAWFYHGTITNIQLKPIPSLFSTGIGTNGAALAPGTPDPHYILSAGAQGTTNASATVMENNPAWLGNDATSTWIGVVNSGNLNISAGIYNYLTRFDVSGFNPGTVAININMASDDRCTNVFLNGVAMGYSVIGFATLSSTFTATTGLVEGTNTLEFRTVNDGANPGGFRAQVRGSGQVTSTNTALPPSANTYYFRKTFIVSGDPGALALRLNALIDDGAVFYLNGTEIYRLNMPAGAIAYSTPANVSANQLTGQIPVPGESLLEGTNVLAVEVHQAAGGPSDILFDAELIGVTTPPERRTLVFNEHTSPGAGFMVELMNDSNGEIDLEGVRIFRDGPVDDVYFLPAGSLGVGQFLALSNTTLGFSAAVGDKLYLFLGEQLLDAIVIEERARGRFPNGNGPWLYPATPTPGAANAIAFHNEIVINEIMYNHQPGAPTNNLPGRPSREQWLELYNNSGSPVDLTGWELGGGIEYRFSPGKTIPAGGYLVVADDSAALRAIYPSIDIVGDYGGRLSGRSDRIVLRDPSGNPADELRYFGGGRWPERADGGGSSLELRDPNADNSKPEAWAASDETGKSTWQTYTYRATAQQIPYLRLPAANPDSVWRDFVFGLLSAGECLVDDITVVESPTNSPVPFIANGDFENGLTGWRVLGTHNQSSVIVDPENPGNHVLRLVATGPQEHMHNHIEGTLINNRAVTVGREYQISFRARWLAGNNLLNTRLYLNRCSRTTALPTPQLNGTPGAQNSRFTPNIGPTFADFGHRPIVPPPGTPVTVSVRPSDPNGIALVQVWWTAAPEFGWSGTQMNAGSDGVYRATIPGYAAGTTVQFFVRAVDSLGAEATFPARGADSGALYTVGDGQANLPLAHNVRIIMTASNINYMHGTAQGQNQTNVMSNDLLPCTVIYDEARAYYDVGIHLRGSQRGRYSDIRTGFHIEFHPDNLFLGQHPVMLIDRSGAGDAPGNRQEEIILKHMLNRAGGIPGTYSQIARVIAPRGAHTGPCQWFPRHEDDFIETAFDNGGDGTMFEMELIYYPLSANPAGYKLPQPDDVNGLDLSDLGNDRETYRYTFMLKNQREADNYSRFVAMCKALSLSGNALDAQTKQLMDIDEWMRAYALVSLCSVGDMYTFGNNHNWFFYLRPSDGKILYFPWDMDFTFTRGSSGGLVGDQNLGKLVSTIPSNLRCFYAHMLDIINTSFNTAYMGYWIDHYDNFAPGQNYSGHLTTIGARVAFVQGQINGAGGNAPFVVNGPATITTTSNLLTFTGTAPVTMKTICVNGKEYPITWTSVSAWRMTLPVSEATNVLAFVGYDVHGVAQTNLARTNIVNYTGPTPDPTRAIVFNEIMYHPQTADTAFVELYNRSSFSFDLSDWRINGLGYTFPKGSIMTNGQYLVLANQISAYATAFGTNAPAPFDEFSGNLQNNGETLTLLRPGANPGEEIIVDKVKYEDVQPWPLAADGSGSSLQLIDPGEDHARVSNWSDGAGWRYVTYTSTIQGSATLSQRGTNFFIVMGSAADVYIDDMKLVFGTVPEAGDNLLVNGDFEAPLTGTWTAVGNHVNTTQSTAVSHGGSGSLHIIATGAGSTANSFVRQFIPGNPTNAVCTLSFWLLPTTNGNQMNVRTAPGSLFTTIMSVQPLLSSPGAPNTAAHDIPAFPSLYLNEVQAENISGPLDNHGEREPWIEIYNAGATPISLDGYYLANNYSNITQWAFPGGSSIAPGEFKIVFADGESSESTVTEWHANFRPQAGQGSVALSWTAGVPQVLDYLNYEALRANWSYGAFPNGQLFTRQAFYRATPAGTNDNSPPPITVSINEWMAANTHTLLNTNNNNRFDDWFELHNPSDLPADLTGYWLTDDVTNKFQYLIPAGYIVPPHGFLLVWADNDPDRNSTNDAALHVSFRLEREGEQIALVAPDGTFVDSVSFEPQFSDVSQGRYPDDASAIYFLSSATPKAPNTSWLNRYPVLSPIADQTALLNTAFSYQVVASDPDGDGLVYSLDLAPTGAVIHATSGLLSWTPPSTGTNFVTVRATDNGPLTLGAARSFNIIVTTGIRIGSVSRSSPNQLSINLTAIPGKHYRAEFKNDLGDAIWTPIDPPVQAQTSSVTIVVPIGPEPHRFFRIVQID